MANWISHKTAIVLSFYRFSAQSGAPLLRIFQFPEICLSAYARHLDAFSDIQVKTE